MASLTSPRLKALQEIYKIYRSVCVCVCVIKNFEFGAVRRCANLAVVETYHKTHFNWKIGFDTAENESSKFGKHLQNLLRSLRSKVRRSIANLVEAS